RRGVADARSYDRPSVRCDPRFPHYTAVRTSTDRLFSDAPPSLSASDWVLPAAGSFIAAFDPLYTPPGRRVTGSDTRVTKLPRLNARSPRRCVALPPQTRRGVDYAVSRDCLEDPT